MNTFTAQVTDLRSRKKRTCTVAWSYSVFTHEIMIESVIYRGEDIKGFLPASELRNLIAECRRQVDDFDLDDRINELKRMMI